MGFCYSKCCCYANNKWTGPGNELEPMPGTVFTWLPHEGEAHPETAEMHCCMRLSSCCGKTGDPMFEITEQNAPQLREDFDITPYMAGHYEENKKRGGFAESVLKLDVEGGQIDILVTKNTQVEGKQPAFLFAHSGGGCIGSAAQENWYAQRCSQDFGCTVFNVDYRLAPEHKCPTGALDFVAAVKHVMAHAAELDIDDSRIVIGGISGGSMVALAAAYHMAKQGEAGKIKAQFLRCPQLSDELKAVSHDQWNDYEAIQGGQTAEFHRALAAGEPSPTDFYLVPGRMPLDELRQCPPTVVFTSEFDYLRRDAIAFIARLKEAGRLLDYYSHPGGIHGYEAGEAGAYAHQETIKAWKKYVDGDGMQDTKE